MSRQDSTRTQVNRSRTLERRTSRALKHAHDGSRTLTRAAHVRTY